jgi:hypothetical protein
MAALSAPLRAVAAGSRVAASDPVKVHPRALSVSRVHAGYFFFAFRIVFDSLEQLARLLARAGGWVAGSFHGFIAAPRFGPGPSLAAAVRRSARPCARPTCSPPRSGCLFGLWSAKLQATGNRGFLTVLFLFYFKNSGNSEFCPELVPGAPREGISFLLIAMPSSSPLTEWPTIPSTLQRPH